MRRRLLRPARELRVAVCSAALLGCGLTSAQDKVKCASDADCNPEHACLAGVCAARKEPAQVQAPRPPCTASQPFGADEPVPSITAAAATASDEGARLTLDELVLYFDSNRDGPARIYVASRASTSDVFENPTLVPGFPAGDSYAVLASPTAVDRTLFFEGRFLGPTQVLYMTRESQDLPFSGPLVPSGINMGPVDGQPAILPDESSLFFMSTRIPGNTYDLYEARHTTTFDTPVPLSSINTPHEEHFPTPTADGLTLYYASERPDGGAEGLWDIWMTARVSRDAEWQPPVDVHELSTSAEEFPTWISADNCRMYFTRTESGVRRIRYAERAP
jgi:hypothetical protein